MVSTNEPRGTLYFNSPLQSRLWLVQWSHKQTVSDAALFRLRILLKTVAILLLLLVYGSPYSTGKMIPILLYGFKTIVQSRAVFNSFVCVIT